MTVKSTFQEDIFPEQILRAAMQLYEKYGLEKVTMDDVSKAIGKSRSSLYYYYKSRDEIFDAVIELLIQEVMQEITVAMNKAVTIQDKIRAFCLTKVKTSIERRAFFKAIESGMASDEASRYSIRMLELHKQLMKLEGNLLKEVITANIKKGESRSLKPKELDMVIFILLSGIRGIKREMGSDHNFTKLNYAVDTLSGMIAKWIEK